MEEPHKAPLNSCTPACPGSLDATAEVAPLPSARTAKANLVSALARASVLRVESAEGRVMFKVQGLM